ncbi:MAG: T9SS type A sorting domain-containing protein [Bacteroidota bacterium]
MKKISTFFLACIIFFVSQAQITLTQNDMALPLTKYIMYNDTLPTAVIPGNAGANQTWIFTSLANHLTDTIIFTKPEWTVYGNSFPTSNLCLMTINSETSYMYLNLNSDSLNLVGQAGKFAGSTTDIIVPMDPTQKITDLPSTYLDGFNGYSEFTTINYVGQQVGSVFIDSVKVKEMTTTVSQFDACGNITTILGTYDALRVNVLQIMNDNVWAKINGINYWVDFTATYGGIDTTKRYSWWTNGLGYMILEMDVDPATDSVINVKYISALPQPGGLEHYEINDAIIVFPNPASETVNISTPENAAMVEVFSTSGQLMKSAKTNNTMVSHIDISGLPSGSYIIRISGNDRFTICHKNLIVE